MSGGDWKKPFYAVAKQDSRNMAKLGNALGWDWLEQEGKKNVENPGRAVGKAATSALLWYLGGPAWGGGSGAAGSAAGTTAEEAAKIAAEEAAKEAAKQEALNSAQYAMQEGLLSGTSQAPQGFANTMEAGLMDTGYVPSNLWQAAKNSGSPGGLLQNVQSWGKQQATEAGNGSLLNRMGANAGDKRSMFAAQQGMRMMQPKQRHSQPPPPPQPQEPPPMIQPYGGSGGPYGGLLGMSEEEKRRRLMMGYPV